MQSAFDNRHNKSGGTGVLRAGEIHPDLSNRLADEAMRSANTILQMCIRATDDCPPVGITFGDYLRAVITDDHDLSPPDAHGYRLAFIESFRQWGIYPAGLPNLSLEALLWPRGIEPAAEGYAASATRTAAVEPLFGELTLKPWDLYRIEAGSRTESGHHQPARVSGVGPYRGRAGPSHLPRRPSARPGSSAVHPEVVGKVGPLAAERGRLVRRTSRWTATVRGTRRVPARVAGGPPAVRPQQLRDAPVQARWGDTLLAAVRRFGYRHGEIPVAYGTGLLEEVKGRA